MMEHCSQMMGGDQADSGKPNEQWRDGAPSMSGQTEQKK
jgi:hypothetical protein